MKNAPEYFTENIEICSDWSEITQAFDLLPKPILSHDEHGETFSAGWIYRGHKNHEYRLVPSIEREAKNGEWAELEYRLLREFQSRASMHMSPAQIPQQDCKLSWLAMMQHHGAPTRLLDFTYSPYVALYFALRHRGNGSGDYAEVWGMDAEAIRHQAESIFSSADWEARKDKGVPPRFSSLRFCDMSSSLERAQEEDDY